MNNVQIGDKTTLSNCVVCSKARIGNEMRLKDETIGYGATVGEVNFET